MDTMSLISSFSHRLELVRCVVPGRAVSQGSKDIYTKGGRSWMVETNAAKLNVWRNFVNAVCMKSYDDHLKDENVHQSIASVKGRLGFHLHVDFVFHEPTKKPAWFPLYLSAPDADKLFRAIGDALTDTTWRPRGGHRGVWPDDAAVCAGSFTKRYGPCDQAAITVWLVTP